VSPPFGTGGRRGGGAEEAGDAGPLSPGLAADREAYVWQSPVKRGGVPSPSRSPGYVGRDVLRSALEVSAGTVAVGFVTSVDQVVNAGMGQPTGVSSSSIQAGLGRVVNAIVNTGPAEHMEDGGSHVDASGAAEVSRSIPRKRGPRRKGGMQSHMTHDERKRYIKDKGDEKH